MIWRYQGHVILAMMALGLAWCSSPPLLAQVANIQAHPELLERVQDDHYVSRMDKSGHIFGPEYKIAAAYRFEMVYDSTSRVQYLFTECLHNSTKPRLFAWRNKRIHAATAEQMTDSSRTENFHIAVGDTVSFHREFRWYAPKTMRQDTDNFISPDTLGYAVELVKATSGARLVLLDSFGVLPQATPSAPTFFGTRPIIATVKYVVPSTIPTSDSVFVRVRLYTNGEGSVLPVRMDDWTIGSSFDLSRGYWNDYLSLFGGALGKRSVTDFSSPNSQPANSQLSVTKVSRNSIRIDFSATQADGPIQVVIYDSNGQPIFTPFATRGAVEGGTTSFDFPTSGSYFVALQRGGSILTSQKVTISK